MFLDPCSSQEVDVSVPAAGLMFALLAHYQVIFRLSRVDDVETKVGEGEEEEIRGETYPLQWCDVYACACACEMYVCM